MSTFNSIHSDGNITGSISYNPSFHEFKVNQRYGTIIREEKPVMINSFIISVGDAKPLIYLKKSLHNNSNNNQFIPLPPSFIFEEAEIVLPTMKFQFNVRMYPFQNYITTEKEGKFELDLVVVFFSSSNIERGERHPIASHGEILQENASVSPPTKEALAAGFPSYKTADIITLSRERELNRIKLAEGSWKAIAS
ncbi:hypothetical protein PanWU01x14_113810 [Parasponia andersonii]|uniref:Uncharacterized protein n=1 Tax=Parasponia andersonii TaxID=3476 RepID=A0A2P5CXW3_PARAD|nr:hypothetical protein PanWU01x14_113810 [Parasponia andersonii]